MNEEYDLKFCPECGTKTLEVEKDHSKTHCANCGQFITVFIDPNSKIKKGYLLNPVQESKISKDPNFGLSAFQIACNAPGMKEYKTKRNERN